MGSNISSLGNMPQARYASREWPSAQFARESSPSAFFFFIQSAGLVWNHALACMASPKAYGSTEGVFLLHLDSMRLLSNQFHTAKNCGFHTRLWRDLGAWLQVHTKALRIKIFFSFKCIRSASADLFCVFTSSDFYATIKMMKNFSEFCNLSCKNPVYYGEGRRWRVWRIRKSWICTGSAPSARFQKPQKNTDDTVIT